jgi:hypothetical protein
MRSPKGIRVALIRITNVRYEVGLFRADDEEIAAEGRFIHASVDRKGGRPVLVAERGQEVLARIPGFVLPLVVFTWSPFLWTRLGTLVD